MNKETDISEIKQLSNFGVCFYGISFLISLLANIFVILIFLGILHINNKDIEGISISIVMIAGPALFISLYKFLYFIFLPGSSIDMDRIKIEITQEVKEKLIECMKEKIILKFDQKDFQEFK